jgi:hypothetical protein
MPALVARSVCFNSGRTIEEWRGRTLSQKDSGQRGRRDKGKSQQGRDGSSPFPPSAFPVACAAAAVR